MPWPAGPVQVGVNGENAYLHIVKDGATIPVSEQPEGTTAGAIQAQAVPAGSFMEMLLGHRSGTGSTNTNRVLRSAAQAIGSLIGNDTGAGVTYAAATLTDTNQNWPGTAEVNKGVWAGGQFNVILSHTATVLTLKSNWATTPAAATPYFILALAAQNQGGTVTYAAGPTNALVDTAAGWTVNQWQGFWVYVGPEARLIVSNTATQLTLDAAWQVATPAAGQAYGIADKIYQDWNTVQRGSTSGKAVFGPNLNPDNL